MRTFFLFLLLFSVSTRAQAVAALFTLSPADSKKCVDSEICFPTEVVNGEESFRLVGIAKYRYLFLNCYYAALYTPTGEADRQSYQNEQSKIIAIHYIRGISAERIRSASSDTLDDHPDYDSSDFTPQLKALYEMFQDVEDGDRAVLVFVPSQGLSVHFNNKMLGTVAGGNFVKAYSGVWLSPYSVSRSFTETLLTRIN